MNFLLMYLKKYKKESILAPFFKLLEASLELMVPLLMARIIDRGILQKDSAYILRMCGILFCFGIIGLMFSVIAQYFAAKAATGMAKELRAALFEKILSFSFTQLDHTTTEKLLTRLTSDSNQVQSGCNLFLRLLLRSPFVVIGSAIMAFMVDAKLSLIFIIVIPLLAVIIGMIMFFTIPLYRRAQMQLDQLMLHIRENLVGVRILRAFNQEEQESQAYRMTNQALFKKQQFASSITALMNPLTYVVVNIAMIILLKLGATKIENGWMMKGQVIALLSYLSQILVELMKLATLMIQVTKAMASADRIAAVLNTPCVMQDGERKWDEVIAQNQQQSSGEATVAIAFDQVSLCYEGDSQNALENLSFEIFEGQTVGIIGGTGSGKSSLVHLIPRFYDVTQGSVRIFGEDVRQYQLDTLRQQIGFVFQNTEVFKGTIADNLKWGKNDATQVEMEEALSIAQASEYVFQKSEGLSYLLDQQGRNLSGGQKQRLAIARALIRKPQILILDDSSSALDLKTDAQLKKALKHFSKFRTTLIVSQRASFVKQADLILVLEKGRLVGKGTHDELLAKNAVYQEIYYSQFPKGEHES